MEECFDEWAFGKDHEALFLWQKRDRWNSRHGEMFNFTDRDTITDSFHLMRLLYNTVCFRNEIEERREKMGYSSCCNEKATETERSNGLPITNEDLAQLKDFAAKLQDLKKLFES